MNTYVLFAFVFFFRLRKVQTPDLQQCRPALLRLHRQALSALRQLLGTFHDQRGVEAAKKRRQK